MMTPEALKHAADNAPLLRRLAGEPVAQLSVLAAEIGKDKSNVRRSLEMLATDGLVERDARALTSAGVVALQALDLTEGRLQIGTGGVWLTCDQIVADPDNDRQDFDSPEAKASIISLAGTLASEGMKQPPHVRPVGADGLHKLAFGERRWRAWHYNVAAGVWPIDHAEFCPIEMGDDLAVAKAAAVENFQRKDLNHMEQARAYERLARLGLDNGKIATLLDKTSEHVWQHRRLLKLSPEDQALVILGPGKGGGLSLHDALSKLVETPRQPADTPALLAAIEAKAEPAAEPVAEAQPGQGKAAPVGGMYRDAFAQQIAEAAAEEQAEPEPAPEIPVWARVMLLELAHKIAAQPFTHERLGQPATSVGAYWLDGRNAELAAMRLVQFTHLPGGHPPVASFGGAGLAWLRSTHAYAEDYKPGDPITDQDVYQAQSLARPILGPCAEGTVYSTGWLAKPIGEGAEGQQEGDAAEPVDDVEKAEAALSRAEGFADFAGRWSDPPAEIKAQAAGLLQALGLAGPFRAAEGDNAGGVFDANGEEVATVDVHRDLPDALARAHALLIAAALNALCGVEVGA